jgi:ABC-2 type transport system ATP-binding protein
MTDAILKVENFSKHFRSHWTFLPIKAVENISFDVKRGESFGFIGHNGAGKTTTIKSILGLIKKTQGKFFLDGEELTNNAQHKDIGYLPEQPYFYEHLTVFETLDFFASLHGYGNPERKKLVRETLEKVGIPDRAKSPVRALSKGLQQRLAVAQAIINSPKLLFLDEPFSGLDPIGRYELRQLLVDLHKQGTTLFMSSHVLSDVENLCNRIGIMVKGKLSTVFDLKETPKLFGESYQMTIKDTGSNEKLLEEIKSYAKESNIEHTVEGNNCRFLFSDYTQAEKAFSQVANSGDKIVSFVSKGLNLEEIFVKITKEQK